MSSLKNITELVKHILEVVPETRNSDNLLYYMVCESLNKNALTNSFGMVVLYLKDYNLPPFESVRRARQKLQAEFPDLSAEKKIKDMRDKKESEYRRFARKGSA